MRLEPEVTRELTLSGLFRFIFCCFILYFILFLFWGIPSYLFYFISSFFLFLLAPEKGACLILFRLSILSCYITKQSLLVTLICIVIRVSDIMGYYFIYFVEATPVGSKGARLKPPFLILVCFGDQPVFVHWQDPPVVGPGFPVQGTRHPGGDRWL